MLQHILYTLLLLLVLGVPTSGWAAPPEEAYDSAISLIDRLYLHPDEVNERVLLQAAAYRASEQIHWLMVESSGDTVYLYHGSGTAIGSLTVGSMQTLPSALVDLEKLLLSSGYDLDGVPVRLTLLKGITDALDYYSRILADEAKARFDTRLKGTLVGAGLTLQWNERGLMVTDLVTGAPADLGGVRVGDRLLRIDGRSVASMPVSEASRRIRGEEGTQVCLLYTSPSPRDRQKSRMPSSA